MLLIAPLARLFGLRCPARCRPVCCWDPAASSASSSSAIAVGQSLLKPPAASLVLIVAALTMASIPLLSRLGQALAAHVAPPRPVDTSLLVPATHDTSPRVIVAGFGRVGQTVAAMLEVHGIPYVAIDHDADRVARQRRQGKPVYWGDITHIELLRRLHLDTARALVVTLDDPASADALVAGARSERADLLIVARARDSRHAAHLYRIGASDAVPETIEASLQLSEAVLVDVGVPMGPVIASIHEKRSELQAGIKAMAPDAEVRMFGRRRLRDALERKGGG